MREGFSISATIEAVKLLVPCTFCDELVVKGNDCPSGRGSLVVQVQHLAQQDNKSIVLVVPILKWLILTRNKEKIIETNHDRLTAHGTTAVTFFAE